VNEHISPAARPQAKAEIWRYDDAGHPEHGTWSWQLIDRPWGEPMPNERDGHLVDLPASDIPYPTWRSAFDAAFHAVTIARHPTPTAVTA
jgi:hypothetical protein